MPVLWGVWACWGESVCSGDGELCWGKAVLLCIVTQSLTCQQSPVLNTAVIQSGLFSSTLHMLSFAASLSTPSKYNYYLSDSYI